MLNLKFLSTSQPVGVHPFLPLLALFVVLLLTALPVCAQTGEEAYAVVNGQRITQKEVDDSIISQLLPLRQQIYELRKKALDNLIVRELLESEAKRRGVSVDELRRSLTEAKVEVSPADVEKVYAENASVLAAMGADEAKERIRLDLEGQARMRNYRAALSKLRESAKVEVHLEDVRLPVTAGAEAFSRGPKGAAVTIVEFSDFQCPYCRGVQPALKQVIKDYGTDVRLVFKNLPLADIHEQATPSALAAVCAGEQGSFWQYHEALFASEDLSSASLNKIAESVGLSLPQFKSCLDSEKARSAVLADVQEARRMGISGTPAFIINGKLISGAISLGEFRRLINLELKSLPGASASR